MNVVGGWGGTPDTILVLCTPRRSYALHWLTKAWGIIESAPAADCRHVAISLWLVTLHIVEHPVTPHHPKIRLTRLPL